MWRNDSRVPPETILDCGAIIFPCSNALRWNATRRLCLQHQRQSRKAKMPLAEPGHQKKQIRTGQIFGEPTKVDGFSTSRPGALNACPQRQYIPTVQRNPVGAMHSDGVFMSLPKLQCRMHRPYPDTPKPQKKFLRAAREEGKKGKVKKCKGHEGKRAKGNPTRRRTPPENQRSRR